MTIHNFFLQVSFLRPFMCEENPSSNNNTTSELKI